MTGTWRERRRVLDLDPGVPGSFPWQRCPRFHRAVQ